MGQGFQPPFNPAMGQGGPPPPFGMAGSPPGPGLQNMPGASQMSPTQAQFGAPPMGMQIDAQHAPPSFAPPSKGPGPMINPQRAAALGLR